MTYSQDFEDLAVSALRCCAIDAVPVSYTHLTLPTTPYV